MAWAATGGHLQVVQESAAAPPQHPHSAETSSAAATGRPHQISSQQSRTGRQTQAVSPHNHHGARCTASAGTAEQSHGLGEGDQAFSGGGIGNQGHWDKTPAYTCGMRSRLVKVSSPGAIQRKCKFVSG